jgi:hypothetical protein
VSDAEALSRRTISSHLINGDLLFKPGTPNPAWHKLLLHAGRLVLA